MLPVLYRFVFETAFTQVVLYAVALGLVAYSASNGCGTRAASTTRATPSSPARPSAATGRSSTASRR